MQRFATWYVCFIDYLPDRIWRRYTKWTPRWFHTQTYGRCERRSLDGTWRLR